MKKILGAIGLIFTFFYVGYIVNSELYGVKESILNTGMSLLKENILLIIVINVLFYLFDTIRFLIIGKIFNLNLTFKEAFGAITLNVLCAWLTPGAIMGAPASTYYLYKKGHPLVESIAASAVRSFSIIITSVLTTIFITKLNTHGHSEVSMVQEAIYQILIGVGIYLFCLLLLSLLPKRLTNRFRFLSHIREKVRDFIKRGWKYSMHLLSISLIINFLLVAFLFFVSMGSYDSLVKLFSQSMLFLSYLLLMPTPGASGLAEVGAPMFFSNELSTQFLTSATMAMRASTLLVQIVVGIIFLVVILKNSIRFKDIENFKTQVLKKETV